MACFLQQKRKRTIFVGVMKTKLIILIFTAIGLAAMALPYIGEGAGYLGAIRDTRKWIISDVTIKGNTATLTIINDYGSEDLVATLTHNADGTYTLKQVEGSTIRIVVDNKWVKLPKTMLFK